MKLLEVTYGTHEIYLRSWNNDDPKWLKGIECNAYGMANRDGCRENSELWIARRRIEHTEEVEAKEQA